MTATKLILIVLHLPVIASMIYALAAKTREGNNVKLLKLFLITTGVLQLVSLGCWLLNINNLPVLHLLVPLRFVLIILIYRNILNGYIRTWVLYLLVTGFVLYSVINTLWTEPWNTFNAQAMTIESVILVILSLSTYMFLMDKQMTKHLGDDLLPSEWINAGVFLYYTSSLLLMYFGEYIIRELNPQLNRYTWIMHGIFCIIMYYCFWRALWNYRTRSLS